MKKFVLIQNGKEEPVGKYATKAEAADVMKQIIDDNNDDLDSDDENYLTAFDFHLEEVEVGEINEIVLSFDNCVQLADIAHLVQDVNPNHIKALVALNELFTIAEAWNKADNFVPDFSDASQSKYFPWFVYDKGAAGFVYASTLYTASNSFAYFGSRLCFKTRNRAIQFGKQFVDLYNQVFLLNK